ncbi:MerR family transcriptional regulator [Fusobacterium sp. THCT1E2]
MKEYYLINEVSKITEIPVSTLRYYSNENLVTPAFRDKKNNYNYYSLEQIFNLKLINYIRNLGISLEQIKEYIFAKEDDKFEKILKEIISEIQNKIVSLKIQKKILEKHLMNYKVNKNVELDTPFIKVFEDIKGIEISSEEKIFEKSSLKFEYKYFGFKIFQKELESEIKYSHLYISFKNRDNKSVILKKGSYICMWGESFFKKEDIFNSIKKAREWSRLKDISISQKAFIFFEDEYTLFKESSKVRYLVMIPVDNKKPVL